MSSSPIATNEEELVTRIDVMVRGLQSCRPNARRIRERMTVCNGLFMLFGQARLPTKVRLCQTSPYQLVCSGNGYTICNDAASRTYAVELLDGPAWVSRTLLDGRPITSILAPQYGGIVASSAFGCQLVDAGVGCRFCTARGFRGTRFQPADLELALAIVLECDQLRCLNLNSGSSTRDPDHGYRLLRPFVRAATAAVCPAVNLELMPPNESALPTSLRAWVERIRDDGATSLQINLELWDERLRAQWMPFKGRIPRSVYLNSIRESVAIFGRFKVNSVLLVGLQPVDDLVSATDTLLSIGATPLLEVYRPIVARDATPQYPRTVLRDLMAVRARTGLGTIAGPQEHEGLEGCLACGACSVVPQGTSEQYMHVNVPGNQRAATNSQS